MHDLTAHDAVASEIEALALSGFALRQAAMDRLARLPGYDWAGVYRREGDVLILDAYRGAPTEHTRIPVGVGICGTAVAEDRDIVVEDVRNESNYLACSTQTRSEIVVLIRDASGEVLGQIDIDGHELAAFGDADLKLLRQVAATLAGRWN
jgi:GAF domain-containing protein